MRLTRVFVPGPLAPGAKVALPGTAGEHVVRVLRLTSGAKLILFDGTGGEYEAELGATTKRGVVAHIGVHLATERESPLEITLLQSLARGEKMDWVVQKATELGVARIVPVVTERSVVRLDGAQAEKRRAHWIGVAAAACEQCGRNRLPDIASPQSIAAALRALPAHAVALVFELTESARGVLLPAAPVTSAAILVGPEGGLTPAELAQATTAGFRVTSLGPRVLRTETAAIAAIALLQGLAGDLRAGVSAETASVYAVR